MYFNTNQQLQDNNKQRSTVTMNSEANVLVGDTVVVVLTTVVAVLYHVAYHWNQRVLNAKVSVVLAIVGRHCS